MGKRGGYKGWVRKSVKRYELYLNRLGNKIGEARIVRNAGRWYGEVQTDVKNLFDKPVRSPPFSVFRDALTWLNKQRRQISKILFG